MAAPNVVNVSSIYGKTTGLALTSSSQDVLTCATDKLLKVNSIIVANVDGSNNDEVTVKWYNADNTTAFSLASTVTVPADTTLVVLGKDAPIYLEEGDKIEGEASANSDLQMIVSFEAITD